MRSMSQLGNELYSGKTSFPFVGRRRTWFILAAVLVILSALVPLIRPVQFSIEFTGGSQFTVSGSRTPDQSLATEAVQSVVPDAATKVTTVGSTAVRVQTDQLTPAETQEVTDALAAAYEVPVTEVTASFIGPSWGQRRHAAVPVGSGHLPRPDLHHPGAVLPHVEDVGRRDPGPRSTCSSSRSACTPSPASRSRRRR